MPFWTLLFLYLSLDKDLNRLSTRLPNCSLRSQEKKKKKKNKVVKNIMLYGNGDILVALGESCFQTRKVHYWWHKHWSLVVLKIWSISAKFWVQELKKSPNEQGKGSTKRSNQREKHKMIIFCSVNFELFFLCCFL